MGRGKVAPHANLLKWMCGKHPSAREGPSCTKSHRNPDRVRCVPKENCEPLIITQLPNEILAKIFSSLSPGDIETLQLVCRKIRHFCLYHRHALPQTKVQLINCQFGEWHDVLSRKHSNTPLLIKYTLSDPLPHRMKSKEKWSIKNMIKMFAFSRHGVKEAPYQFVSRTCAFKSMIVDVQLLSSDLRSMMEFDKINVSHLIINMSYPFLFARNLRKYLPGICEDLARNRHLKAVSFILLHHQSKSIIEQFSEKEQMDWFGRLKEEKHADILIHLVSSPIVNLLRLVELVGSVKSMEH